mmetsp:Transcript_13621/g.29492  ORF Transcript_13621/g.29492 Transcript_13621/m.29492 type:complete len:240 (+) Transcript_13621:923-1642(+)
MIAAQAHKRDVRIQSRPHSLEILDLLLKHQVPLPTTHDLLPGSDRARERSLGIHQVAANAHEQRAVLPVHGVDLLHALTRDLDLLAPVGRFHGESVHQNAELGVGRDDESMTLRSGTFLFGDRFLLLALHAHGARPEPLAGVELWGLRECGVYQRALILRVCKPMRVEVKSPGHNNLFQGILRMALHNFVLLDDQCQVGLPNVGYILYVHRHRFFLLFFLIIILAKAFQIIVHRELIPR